MGLYAYRPELSKHYGKTRNCESQYPNMVEQRSESEPVQLSYGNKTKSNYSVKLMEKHSMIFCFVYLSNPADISERQLSHYVMIFGCVFFRFCLFIFGFSFLVLQVTLLPLIFCCCAFLLTSISHLTPGFSSTPMYSCLIAPYLSSVS